MFLGQVSSPKRGENALTAESVASCTGTFARLTDVEMD